MEDHIDLAYSYFATATQKSNIALSESELLKLAKYVAFSTKILSTNHFYFEKSGPYLNGRPSAKTATTLANKTRLLFNVNEDDPLFELPKLITNKLGILVFPIDSNKFTGGFALFDSMVFIFVSTTCETFPFFICSHQLAHILSITLKNRKKSTAYLEGNISDRNSFRSPFEYFADIYAANLLIPTKGLGKALKQIRKSLRITDQGIGDIEILYLSRIFGVDFLTAAKRCEQESLLPKGGAKALFEFVKHKHGDPEIRATELELPPRPTQYFEEVPLSLLLATVQKIKNKEITIEQASQGLSLPLARIVKSCGIEMH